MNVFHLRFSLVASLMDTWELLMQTCWPPLSDHWSVQPPHLTCLGLCSMAAWKLNGPICAMHLNFLYKTDFLVSFQQPVAISPVENCIIWIYICFKSMKHFQELKKNRIGSHFNANMITYQHRKSYCGDQTILYWLFDLYNGIFCTGKTMSLYQNKLLVEM